MMEMEYKGETERSIEIRLHLTNAFSRRNVVFESFRTEAIKASKSV